MRIYLSRVLIVAVGVVGAVGTGCGNTTAPPPTEYFSFKYTLTPPGTGATTAPLVLPLSDGSTICDRGNKKITLFGLQGVASVGITITGTATDPYQSSLNVDYHTVSTARVDFALPLAFDAMGVGRNPQMLTTADQSQGILCSFDLPNADYFAAINGTFTCTSSATANPYSLNLTEGKIVAMPCGTSP